MAYIQISNDGQRPVGPLGIKKVEQDLIKRRYKQQQYLNNYPPLNDIHLQKYNGVARLSSVYGASREISGNRPSNNYGVNSIYQNQSGEYVSNYSQEYLRQQANPYLRYSREIRSLYKRHKDEQSNSLNPSRLPRISSIPGGEMSIVGTSQQVQPQNKLRPQLINQNDRNVAPGASR